MTVSRPVLSPLAVRLAVAFVAVAVAAVAVLAGLTLRSASDEVSGLVAETHRRDARAAADAAAQAFEQAGGWDDADLSSAVAVAARGQAELTLLDDRGRVLAAPASEAAEMMTRMHGVEILDAARAEPVGSPVLVGGEPVGSVELRFPASHLPAPERQIRAALVRNAWIGAGLAIASAIAVAVVVARVVSRPITALTDAAVRLEGGDRTVRVGMGDAPGELGTLANAFDRMAAAVDEEDRLRRQLVADVAHEVRTPLTILRGTTEALVDGVAEPDAPTLASLHDEVLRLVHLVADLETLAAADSAALHLDLQPVDLADEAAAVVSTARATADAGEITLTASLDHGRVSGDPRRIRQILTTVVANSLGYTPAGGSVEVRTYTEGGRAVAEVVDTGPGIDPADLPHVFDRFYRGRRTAHIAGSGIGLAIARELVHAHGGTIEARSDAEGGAVIRITIPEAP